MTEDQTALIRLLEAELDLIEGGGYGRPAGQPTQDPPMFSESLACINHWIVPGHEGGCHQDCALMQWVPPERRSEELPCHFIPLNSAGDTVHSLEGNQKRLEDAVKTWLRQKIKNLKQNLETPPSDLEVKF